MPDAGSGWAEGSDEKWERFRPRREPVAGSRFQPRNGHFRGSEAGGVPAFLCALGACYEKDLKQPATFPG